MRPRGPAIVVSVFAISNFAATSQNLDSTQVPDKPFVFHSVYIYIYIHTHTGFVQKVSELTKVHEVDDAYGVLTLTVFNIVPFRSYTLRPTLQPLLETFCELLFRDV